MAITKQSLSKLLDVSIDRIHQIANRQLFIVCHIGYKLYFSYKTCIAIERDNSNYIYITNEYFSSTTSSHKKIIAEGKDVNYLDWTIFNDLYDSLAIHG